MFTFDRSQTHQKKSVVNEFFSSTSMHGCLHLSSTGSFKVKLLWTCVIIVACFGAVLHLYNLTSLYLKYEYYESVRKEHGRLQFPDVTLCSSEGYSSFSMFKNNEFTVKWTKRFLEFLKSIITVMANLETKSALLNLIARNEIALATYNKSDLVKFGITLSELVVHCQFQDMKCSQVGGIQTISPSSLYKLLPKMGDSDSGIGVGTGTGSNFDQFGTGVGIGINFFPQVESESESESE